MHIENPSSSSSLLLSRVELSDTKVYDPLIRARVGTAAHFFEPFTVYQSRPRAAVNAAARRSPNSPNCCSLGGVPREQKMLKHTSIRRCSSILVYKDKNRLGQTVSSTRNTFPGCVLGNAVISQTQNLSQKSSKRLSQEGFSATSQKCAAVPRRARI